MFQMDDIQMSLSTPYNGVGMGLVLISPKSRGYLMLNETDPVWSPPSIYQRSYTDESDLQQIIEGEYEFDFDNVARELTFTIALRHFSRSYCQQQLLRHGIDAKIRSKVDGREIESMFEPYIWHNGILALYGVNEHRIELPSCRNV